MRKPKLAEEIVNLLAEVVAMSDENKEGLKSDFARFSKQGLNLMKERLLANKEVK
jgi:hypothetical protein